MHAKSPNQAKNPAASAALSVGVNVKWCPGCETTRARTEFNRNAARADGLCAHCRNCQHRFQHTFQRSPESDLAVIRTVWAALTANPDAKLYQLRQQTGLSRYRVEKALIALEHRGYIKIGRSKHGYGVRRIVVVPLVAQA